MACYNPKDIQSKILDLVGEERSDDFGIEFINKVLKSNIVKYYSNNGVIDEYEIAIKSVLAGYLKDLQHTTDTEKQFYKPEEQVRLNNKLLGLKIGKATVKEFLDDAETSISSEKLINEGSNSNVTNQEKTLADFNVELTNGSKDLLAKWKDWTKSNPHGIVAYRTNSKRFSDPQYALETRSIGNPFMTWLKTGVHGADTISFNKWLKTGDSQGNKLATEELRQAYIELIKDAAKDNAKVLYYTDLPPSQSHAAVIGYYVQHPDELKDNDFTRTERTQIDKSSNQAVPQKNVSKDKKSSKNLDTKDYSNITTTKLANTNIISNYEGASKGFFKNTNVSNDELFDSDVETIIVFSSDEEEKRRIKNRVELRNYDNDNKISLYINPSDEQIKQVIGTHNNIGVFKGQNALNKNLDVLYKNVKIQANKNKLDNKRFLENYELLLFSHKIQHLYNQLKAYGQQRDYVMIKVLEELRNEYNNYTDEEKKAFKGLTIKKLIDNFDYVKSVITITEPIDTDDLEDYENTNTTDVLFSESHSTSNMPKDEFLAGLLSSFPTGKVDELGTPLYYEPMVINNILTRIISGSKDSLEMMQRFEDAKRINKFVQHIIDNINADKSGRLKSMLFTKYANLYAAKYVTINGVRIIDENTSFASTSIDVGIVVSPDPEVCLFSPEFNNAIDSNGNNHWSNIILNLNNVNSVDDLPQDEVDGFRSQGLSDEQIMSMYNDVFQNPKDPSALDLNNSKLKFYLSQAGIELDSELHDLSLLKPEQINSIREYLSTMYRVRAFDGYMSNVDFQKHCKTLYNKILDILNSIAMQKTESLVRTAGESKFIYADKNYINTILDGLSEDNVTFMYDNFLKYDEFNSFESDQKEDSTIEDTYEERAYRTYSSLLKALALSEKPDWFRMSHFFVNKTDDKTPSKYSELTKEELAEINRKMFWKEQDITREGEQLYVWVHAPIYADKGSLHFYRVPVIDIHSEGTDDNSLDPQIITEISNLIRFETNRITIAKERWKQIKNGNLEAIDTYDIDGKGNPGRAHKYCFLPSLNDYKQQITGDKSGKEYSLYDILSNKDVDEFAKEQALYDAAVSIYRKVIEEDVLPNIEKDDNKKVINEAIEALEGGDLGTYNECLNRINSIDIRNIKKRVTSAEDLDNGVMRANNAERIIESMQRALTSFIRQADIKQLTISDEAYYKNSVDVQKRYAQVQAGYQRPDTDSKNAKKYMRTIYLKDSILNLEKMDKVAFDNMEETLTNAAKAAGVDIDVKEIMDAFRKINIADAQCYRTLSSYRSVRDMFGLWTEKDEVLFQKIKNGEKLNADDYSQVWQTIKPFVYTQQESTWKDSNGKEHVTKVGYQYKNSENILFNMFMLFGQENSVLGQLNRFMEENDIDTVQFESAVKVGREGLIDLNGISPENVYDYLREKTGITNQQYEWIDKTSGEMFTLSGNPHVIHTLPYSEYGIKTSTPPHMFDTEQQLGSQLKKLLQGDIPNDPNTKIYLDTEGLLSVVDNSSKDEKGRITFKVNGEEIELHEEEESQPDGSVKIRRYLDKQGYLTLFNGLLSDMMLDEFADVQEIFSDREKLANALQEMMGTSPKYDFDIKQALRVDENGKWIVDPKNPLIRDKVVLLMSSILKNRINKQLTRGGTAIQMACWGGSDVMHEDGTYGPLKIVRNPDGTIRYMECLMPAYSKQWVESMMNKDGVLDPKKCKDDNLLKALCYRVPTEDIYSMIPLKIVGFTPLQFGTNIMLPKEITTLTGSDFDVDKMYLFLPEFKMKNSWKGKLHVNREDFRNYYLNFINERITKGENISKYDLRNIQEYYKKKIKRDLYEKAKANAKSNNLKDVYEAYNEEKQKLFRENAFRKFKETEFYKIAHRDADQQVYDEIENRAKQNGDDWESISKLFINTEEGDITKTNEGKIELKGKRYYQKFSKLISKEEADEIRKKTINSYFNAWAIENEYFIQEPRYIQFDASKDISENSGEAKRNLLLSLMRGAISSPYNITKEQNPGGFDYLKDLAKNINNEVVEPMNLTESQYLNFFNLNMTGKRLIGIYANHNVAHALCQDSGLCLTEGIKVGNTVYQSLSEIKSTDGRRISRNIAEFLAASVDNAKDPVLAKLWQNNYTASTTCFLMRLGVPPNTIMHMFKMLKNNSPYDFQKFMEKGPAAFRQFAKHYEADSSLDKGIVFYTDDNKKVIRTHNFFAMLGHYEQTIQNLETLNTLLKSDSTNGAMYDIPSIIENIIKVKKLKADPNLNGVNNLIPDFEEDKDILTKSKSEILNKLGKNAKSYQVAYYLTWVNFRQYFSEIIDNGMIDECVNLGNQINRFNSDIIKKFITAYSKEQLRYLDIFSPKFVSPKSAEEKKQWIKEGKDINESQKYTVVSTTEIQDNILKEIPKKLEHYKRKYPNNAFIKMLSRSSTENGDYLIMKNIADMRSETINEVKEGFNKLFSTVASNRDAMDLIKYALCVNGFGYDPRSFISMIPIKSLAKIAGINEVSDFFEIDNLDAFEDKFIIDNDLVDYSVDIKQTDLNKGLVKFNSTSKIVGRKANYYSPEILFKKMYEDSDGCWYAKINYKKQGNDIKDKVYTILDEEIISKRLGGTMNEDGIFEKDTENRKEKLSDIADSIIKEMNNRNLDIVSKEDILKILSDKNSLGRFFNINYDPMSYYNPIAIDFC